MNWIYAFLKQSTNGKNVFKRKNMYRTKKNHIAEQIATWHQQSFIFNEVKLFFSYNKTYLSQFDCTQKKLKAEEYSRKILFML